MGQSLLLLCVVNPVIVLTIYFIYTLILFIIVLVA